MKKKVVKIFWAIASMLVILSMLSFMSQLGS